MRRWIEPAAYVLGGSIIGFGVFFTALVAFRILFPTPKLIPVPAVPPTWILEQIDGGIDATVPEPTPNYDNDCTDWCEETPV